MTPQKIQVLLLFNSVLSSNPVMTTQKTQAFYFLTPPFKKSCDDHSKDPSFLFLTPSFQAIL